MITVALSASIASSLDVVWSALVDPGQRVAWDDRILGEVETGRQRRPGARRSVPSRGDAKPDGATERRWRFRLGRIPTVMRDEL